MYFTRCKKPRPSEKSTFEQFPGLRSKKKLSHRVQQHFLPLETILTQKWIFAKKFAKKMSEPIWSKTPLKVIDFVGGGGHAKIHFFQIFSSVTPSKIDMSALDPLSF